MHKGRGQLIFQCTHIALLLPGMLSFGGGIVVPNHKAKNVLSHLTNVTAFFHSVNELK
jgi:hypothetical protein